MRDKRKKKKKFRLRHLLLLLVIFWISKTLISQRLLMRDLTNKKLLEEQNVAQLEKEVQELSEEIKERDSLKFVERVAREDLGMVKPREIIYIDKNKGRKPFDKFIGR